MKKLALSQTHLAYNSQYLSGGIRVHSVSWGMTVSCRIQKLLFFILVGDVESSGEKYSKTDTPSPSKHLPDVRESRPCLGDIGCVVQEYGDWVTVVVEPSATVRSFPQDVHGVSLIV